MKQIACSLPKANHRWNLLALLFAVALACSCAHAAKAFAATTDVLTFAALPTDLQAGSVEEAADDEAPAADDNIAAEGLALPAGGIVSEGAATDLRLAGGLSTQASEDDQWLIKQSGWVTVSGTAKQTDARSLLAMVNSARSKVGAKSLAWDVNLERTAMTRAAEISLFFSHTRTNGTQCFTAWPNYWMAGENIAAGQASATAVNTTWTRSSGHYANMVNKSFTTFAAACFVAPNGTRYWVECFGGTTATGMTTSAVNGSYTASVPFTNDTGKLSISGPTSIAPGETVQFSATIQHKKGSVALPVVASSLTWRTPNIDRVSVSAGKVKGLSEGNVTIIASVNNVSQLNAWQTMAVEPVITYRTHVQNEGWQSFVRNGAKSGTSGKSLRLEGIDIKVPGLDGGVEYRTHIQNIGWEKAWKKNGATSGTYGRSLRLEGIQIKLTGNAAAQYDVYYRVHCQNIGWMGWAKNGAPAGSAGFAYRLEAIEIKLVKKGGKAPSPTAGAFATTTGKQSGIPDSESKVLYRTHVQNVGWQPYMRDGEDAGTSGRSLRLEGIDIKLGGAVSGGIRYRTHIQNIGWEKGWKSNGDTSGTYGRALRLEAIEIELTGDAAKNYDVYYRVHCQNFGWMGWAKNGEDAGSAGYAYRLEAIDVKVVPKGDPAPGPTANAFRQKSTPQPTRIVRSVIPDGSYSYVAGVGGYRGSFVVSNSGRTASITEASAFSPTRYRYNFNLLDSGKNASNGAPIYNLQKTSGSSGSGYSTAYYDSVKKTVYINGSMPFVKVG